MPQPQPDNLEQAKQVIAELTETVNKQQSQIAWLTRQMYASKSERLTRDDEPALFDDVDDGEEASSPAPFEAQSDTQTVTYQRRAKGRGKRSPIPDPLPRYDRIHDRPEDEKVGMKWIGQEVSEQLEMEPGKV
jgi:hypothetical protein